jgi:hypothetical protein
MGYADGYDHVAVSYSMMRHTWKWTRKLFFHLLDLTVLNSFIIFSSCDVKLSQSPFRLTLETDLIQEAERVSQPQTRKTSVFHQPIERHDKRHSKQWPMKGKEFDVVYVLLKTNRNKIQVPSM